MNDPIPFFHDGEYHVFYQYDPSGADGSGAKHWGHISSKDLVSWRRRPIALSLDPYGPDRDGCWTGCVVVDDGTPTILYTAKRKPGIQTQCLARGSSDMTRWMKSPENPVLHVPPHGIEECWRDPCVWKEPDGWYMALGSGIKGRGPAVLLYRSDDLTDWEYLHPLFVGESSDSADNIYECPDFFSLGDKYVLLVSSTSKDAGPRTLYYTGRYVEHRFVPEVRGTVDFGGFLYAGKTLYDEMNRRILFGWLMEGRKVDVLRAQGWAGVLSLPRALTLLPDGRIGFSPPPEIQRLTGEGCRFVGLKVSSSMRILDGVNGRHLEVLAEIEPGDAGRCGLVVLSSSDLRECTQIVYDENQAGRRMSLRRGRPRRGDDAD